MLIEAVRKGRERAEGEAVDRPGLSEDVLSCAEGEARSGEVERGCAIRGGMEDERESDRTASSS